MSSYASIMSRQREILQRATGIDYARFSNLAFDYEAMMATTTYTVDDVRAHQLEVGVGATPMLELRRLTELVRASAEPGMGARILVKDEAANPSGSFKDRRAAPSARRAVELGYEGLVAATSGNYGAAVASQAAMAGLRCIVVQEAYDSHWRGQPEILEKARKCESLGAEVLQTTVGPELFYLLLKTLDDTGFFNASLYTPMSVQGIETLGIEIAEQSRQLLGKPPAAVLATHAGGGMVTGVGRGLDHAGCGDVDIIGVSVDLRGLHMASDTDFNRKSFTTGHTGFAVPFTSWPDRVDVPRNAARPLRYLDRFVTVSQGAVFYATEVLAQLEGLERGPAGNTSLAAALVLARDFPQEEAIVVTETEYTGAGKAPLAQLAFARSMSVDVRAGGDVNETPGEDIVLPTELGELRVEDVDLARLRRSYLERARAQAGQMFTDEDVAFLQEDAGLERSEVLELSARV